VVASETCYNRGLLEVLGGYRLILLLRGGCMRS